jgi:hypothetical protein
MFHPDAGRKKKAAREGYELLVVDRDAIALELVRGWAIRPTAFAGL